MKTQSIGWLAGGCGLVVAGVMLSFRPDVPPRPVTVKKARALPSAHETPPVADATLDPRLLSEIRAVMADTDPQRRAEAIRAWLASIDPAQLPAILASLSAEELGTDVAAMLLRHWAGNDPEAAAAWAAAQPRTNKSRMALMETAVAVWWERDYLAAVDWLMTLREPDEQIQLLSGLEYVRETADVPVHADDPAVVREVSQRAGKDVNAAAEWVVALPEGRDRLTAIKYLAEEWSTRDMRSAMAWAHSLPQPGDRKAAFTAALVHLPIHCQEEPAE